MADLDFITLRDGTQISANLLPRDVAVWHCHTRTEAFYAAPDGTPRHWKNPDGSRNVPDYVQEVEGNLLVRGGASIMWECLKGSGTTASTAAKKYFNATAAIGVGNSTAAAANTQTALQGGSKTTKALTGGYPTHTTGSTAATVVDIVYKSTFGTADANFTWNEWGLFNKTTATANARMLNRKVQAAMLTKSTAATATMTITLSLA